MRPPRWPSLLGISLVSAAVLMLEVTLTRIFSVTMWYHLAFMSISLALMGGAMAGVYVYLFGHRLSTERLGQQLTWLTILFSASIVVCFYIYLRIPFDAMTTVPQLQPEGVRSLALIYFDLAVPFFFGGACLSLAISRWSAVAGRVYFADLIGAAVGCWLSVVMLNALGGPGAVLSAAVLAALAALAFSRAFRLRFWPLTVLWLAASLGVVGWGGNSGAFHVVSTKIGEIEQATVYERWNSFSRVTVHEHWTPFPFGWGLSEIHQEPDIGHYLVLIDAAAGTPIQRFDGDLSAVQFLRDDVTSMAYYLRPNASVLIIGPGGGRDVLTGLVFGARRIVGVEINPAIVGAVRGEFADYAGHVYDQPGVSIYVDDARGFIARSKEQYDIIQASLIDTWAAASANAFALSENSLYTVEAFQDYFDHLTPDGVLSVSRWLFSSQPAETLRLVNLGLVSWQRQGVADPTQHLAVVIIPKSYLAPEAMATVLLKRTPFTADEVATLQREAERLHFVVLYAPGVEASNPVADFVRAADREAVVRGYAVDISPTTDDRPFFFNLARFGDVLNASWEESTVYRNSAQAIRILTMVLGVSGVMVALFIIGPLVILKRETLRGEGWAARLVYFAALGLAFMLVEIPVVQRLTIYLGHPIYALVVVLSSLLLAGGVGSLFTGRVAVGDAPRFLTWLLPALGAVILAHVLIVPWLLAITQPWLLVARIALSAGLIAPLGVLMGQPFPLGLKWTGAAAPDAVPWMWGVNGAASVMGAVLAMAVALHLGFRVTLLTGLLCYAGAWVTVRWLAGRKGL